MLWYVLTKCPWPWHADWAYTHNYDMSTPFDAGSYYPDPNRFPVNTPTASIYCDTRHNAPLHPMVNWWVSVCSHAVLSLNHGITIRAGSILASSELSYQKNDSYVQYRVRISNKARDRTYPLIAWKEEKLTLTVYLTSWDIQRYHTVLPNLSTCTEYTWRFHLTWSFYTLPTYR